MEPLGSLLGASWEPLGGLLGASWEPLGPSREPLGDPLGGLWSSSGALEALGEPLRQSEEVMRRFEK